MRHLLLMVVTILLVLPAAAQKAPKQKKKIQMPAAVAAAQFVYVTSFHGDAFNPNTTREDRQAMARIESALQSWGKYRVVYQPENADIMLVVRPGAVAEARTGIDIGSPPVAVGPNGGRVQTGPSVGIGVGPMAGVDISNAAEDMLAVSMNPQEPAVGAPFIWRRTAHHGLQGKGPALFEEFRKEVDEIQRQMKTP